MRRRQKGTQTEKREENPRKEDKTLKIRKTRNNKYVLDVTLGRRKQTKQILSSVVLIDKVD